MYTKTLEFFFLYHICIFVARLPFATFFQWLFEVHVCGKLRQVLDAIHYVNQSTLNAPAAAIDGCSENQKVFRLDETLNEW